MSQISGASLGWQKYDMDAVVNSTTGEIQHGRSAGKNLLMAGGELFSAGISSLALPATLLGFRVLQSSDSSGRFVGSFKEYGQQVKFGLGAFAAAGALVGAAVKDTTDAAVHGVMAGWKAITG